jgi:nicotinamide riboside kinase
VSEKALKILFTGPECSGKSTLSSWLHSEKNWPLVPEVARTYLTTSGPGYTQEDVAHMACLQWQEEERYTQCHSPFICDTDLLTYLIWQQEKYGSYSPWIKEKWEASAPGICFLCMPDFDWVYDPLRENPNDRHRLLSLYFEFLEYEKIPYKCLNGSISDRKNEIIQML